MITEQHRSLPSFSEEYIHFTHLSGLNVYILPKNFPDYFISIGVNYGSYIDTVEGEVIPLGTAHFMEHMMFHTKDGGDITDQFATYGANVNAYTTNEYTAYFCYGTKSRYAALSTLIDMMLHPHFDASIIDNERRIIEQEIAMYNDDPYSNAYHLLMQGLYPIHPIRNDIAGSAESIQAVSKVLLENIHRIYYTPANMNLVLCGRFDASKIKTLLDKLLPTFASGKPFLFRPTNDSGKIAEKKSMELGLSRPILLLGYRDPINVDGTDQSKRGHIAQIACNAIFSKSGDLYHMLFEQGLCGKDFTATYEWSHGCGHVLITTTSNHPIKTLESLEIYISKLCANPPSRDAFERAKNVIYADTIRVFDSVEDFTMDFLEEVMSDDDFFNIPERIASITYDELCAFIYEVFSPANYTSVLLQPKEKQEC